MSGNDPLDSPSNSLDRYLSFTLPALDARGRIVRLNTVLDEILSYHSYPLAIARFLAEALTLTALLGSLLEGDESQLTLQIRAEGGILDLLVCDYRNGVLRGYLNFDRDKVENLEMNASLKEVVGEGYLAIIFDQAITKERYQGIVALTGDSLTAAVENYFVQSEQIPTLARVAIQPPKAAQGWIAGGILLQHLPKNEVEGERLTHTGLDNPAWDHVSALGQTIKPEELTESALSCEDIIWRLFHEEKPIRITETKALSTACRCGEAHFKEIIMRFPEEQRLEMGDENGLIQIDCEFCGRHYTFPAVDK
ncbi:MAG: Hsp33 family molecular chaperone HslO [Zymomonas mobilis subsp. pomaceae]|uniref:Hsp33 protein n=1 Tax=Zymomonas mobilis subsp. pomaceae (strain ATCC 29192 / DSM 22645 / JCM 10191 / CCUG 17912 / NBRC 13757 / NCIMB 11200 / NRRL B-4491 / Barker I) TaxID=579138 RepID=F8ESC3_ZYMMT|nr:Hsp33 family molecular chaperone HslO [Zymomonas mobilis]AEI37698.1 Hsp33 protein [Zymomonas mobilis subsp. pomaceae ATCC 29192]MDX5949065.1 Hsp33 family molecular chaperone HslO [Zymomonas mobilis subsp. pomaceae]GEB88870.1 33 kDa chaperonin [Zymomonas mobilis subsp. pomaceae]